MQPDGTAQVQSALRLMKRGRFLDAVTYLRTNSLSPRSSNRISRWQRCVLADALQRIGKNEEAESIASGTLSLGSDSADLTARCHFILGNVFRDRGHLTAAVEHFYTADKFATASNDLELSCWVQLRLIATVAELQGSKAAMAQLEGVKRRLVRFGDARPFAALHLWIAESESLRGKLESARRHLAIAESRLKHVDDVWLQGYLAINSSCVSFDCAEVQNAHDWAQVALSCARTSGHQGARKAAYANLGQIELSLGHFTEAEQWFTSAVECCNTGSADYIAILDNLAQLRLYCEDLAGCRDILETLDHIGIHSEHSRFRHYRTWTLQTRIQLLLREGRLLEAKALCGEVEDISPSITHPRVSTVLQLLTVETLAANRDFLTASQRLAPLLSSSTELPPDLFAETERIIAKTLLMSGASEFVRYHLDRASWTFEVINNSIGKKDVAHDFECLPAPSFSTNDAPIATRSLDRFRALLDTRRRPELFGREALTLLQELGCTTNASLNMERTAGVGDITSKACTHAASGPSDPVINIDLGFTGRTTVRLSFTPKADSASIVASLSFQRVIEQILATTRIEPEFSDCEILWTADELLSNQGIVFAAESMLAILRTIRKVSSSDLSVLLTGETGTGKEVLARAIHQQSGRVPDRFIALNCAAVPRDLLESQLFGYRRGAFSGATEPFQGVIRAADRGTLLLDEIGEMPLEMQPKLLRFLESGEVHPLGEAHPSKVNVRLLFATNSNLEDSIRRGQFREDLFFRLNVVPIAVPPLRERKEEIPLLVNLFAERFASELSKDVPRFSTDAMELLILYPWPGNVRQLCNEVRRLIATTDDGRAITEQLLSPDILKSVSHVDKQSVSSARLSLSLDQNLPLAVRDLELSMVKHALQKAGGQVSSAAEMLGISRKGLYLKRQRLGLLDQWRQASTPGPAKAQVS